MPSINGFSVDFEQPFGGLVCRHECALLPVAVDADVAPLMCGDAPECVETVPPVASNLDLTAALPAVGRARRALGASSFSALVFRKVGDQLEVGALAEHRFYGAVARRFAPSIDDSAKDFGLFRRELARNAVKARRIEAVARACEQGKYQWGEFHSPIMVPRSEIVKNNV